MKKFLLQALALNLVMTSSLVCSPDSVESVRAGARLPVAVPSAGAQGELLLRNTFTVLTRAEAGKAVHIGLEIPFDAPSGECDLVHVSPGASGTLLKKVKIEGVAPRFPDAPRHWAKPAMVDHPKKVLAGGEFGFRLSFPVDGAAEALPPVVVRMGIGPDRPLHYARLEVQPDESLRKSDDRVLSGLLKLKLPADLPAGDYDVEVALIGEAWRDAKPADLMMGRISIDNSNTGVAPRKVLSSGTYVDGAGVPHLWCVSPEHTLLWDGQPFIPVGGMMAGPYVSHVKTTKTLDAFLADLETYHRASLDYVYLYTQTSAEKLLPHQWQTVIDTLESKGMTYTLGYPTSARYRLDRSAMREVAARPVRAAARLRLGVRAALPGEASRVIKRADVGFALTKTTFPTCQAVAIDAAGEVRAVADASVAPQDGGSAEVKVSFANLPAGDYEVVFLPELRVDPHAMGNPWFDPAAQLSSIRELLSQIRFGPGFRGIIDLGLENERGIYNQNETLFLCTAEFLAERKRWLEEAYRDLASLGASWRLTRSLKSFEQAARIYPIAMLDAGTSSLKQRRLLLLDPQTSEVFSAHGDDSPFWTEYLRQRDESLLRIQDHYIDGIRDIVDVPVTIKRVGQTRIYNSGTSRTDRGMDGVGYELYGAKESLVNAALGYGYAELLQAGKSMFASATEMNRGASPSMPPNWPGLSALSDDIATTLFFCGKGFNFFLLNIAPSSIWTRNQIINDPRVLEWMALWREIVASRRDEIAAHKPYVYTSWPVPDPWWPKPSQRRAVGGIADAPGLLPSKAPNGVWVVPVHDASVPSDVTFVTLSGEPADKLHGPAFEALLRANDRLVVMLGLRKKPGALSIDRFYSDEIWTEGDVSYQALRPGPSSRILHKDAQGRVWALQEGGVQIVAAAPARGDVTLEAMLSRTTMPAAPAATRVEVAAFMSQILGISPLSAADGRLSGIAYTLGGEPEVALHTTSRAGGERVRLAGPGGRVFRVRLPGQPDWREVAAGETVEIALPAGPGENENVGAGKGLVRVRGVSSAELVWTFPDIDQKSSASVTPALPATIEWPTIAIEPPAESATMEQQQAASALQHAARVLAQGEAAEALRVAEEWSSLGNSDVAYHFDLVAGVAALRLGEAKTARSAFERALKVRAGDPAALHGRALSDYLSGDADAARALLQKLAAAAHTEATKADKNRRTLGLGTR